jgi:hypothetical protein
MINREQAIEIARAYVSELKWPGIQEMIIYDRGIIERPFGWVFHYNSRAFIETGDFHDDAIGNAPIIVDRTDGSVHLTGTAYPLEYYFEKYERQRAGRPAPPPP